MPTVTTIAVAVALLAATALAGPRSCVVPTPEGNVDLSTIPTSNFQATQNYKGSLSWYDWTVNLCAAVSQPPIGGKSCTSPGFVTEYSSTNGACETAFGTPVSEWTFAKGLFSATFANDKNWHINVNVRCGKATPLTPIGFVNVTTASDGQLIFNLDVESNNACFGTQPPPPPPAPVSGVVVKQFDNVQTCSGVANNTYTLPLGKCVQNIPTSASTSDASKIFTCEPQHKQSETCATIQLSHNSECVSSAGTENVWCGQCLLDAASQTYYKYTCNPSSATAHYDCADATCSSCKSTVQLQPYQCASVGANFPSLNGGGYAEYQSTATCNVTVPMVVEEYFNIYSTGCAAGEGTKATFANNTCATGGNYYSSAYFYQCYDSANPKGFTVESIAASGNKFKRLLNRSP